MRFSPTAPRNQMLLESPCRPRMRVTGQRRAAAWVGEKISDQLVAHPEPGTMARGRPHGSGMAENDWRQGRTCAPVRQLRPLSGARNAQPVARRIGDKDPVLAVLERPVVGRQPLGQLLQTLGSR